MDDGRLAGFCGLPDRFPNLRFNGLFPYVRLAVRLPNALQRVQGRVSRRIGGFS